MMVTADARAAEHLVVGEWFSRAVAGDPTAPAGLGPEHIADPFLRAVASALFDLEAPDFVGVLEAVSLQLRRDPSEVVGRLSDLSRMPILGGKYRGAQRIVEAFQRREVNAKLAHLADLAGRSSRLTSADVRSELDALSARLEPPLRRNGLDVAAAAEVFERRRAKLEPVVPVPWAALAPNFGASLGIRPGCHVVVGPSGVGKTQWALQLALRSAQQSVPTHYVGLELDNPGIVARLVSIDCRWRAVRNAPHWSRLWHGVAEVRPEVAQSFDRVAGLARAVLLSAEYIGQSGYSPDRITTAARALRERAGDGPALLVVDYLQLVGPPADARRMDDRQRVSLAAYTARHAASAYGIAIVLISSTARKNTAASQNHTSLFDRFVAQSEPVLEAREGRMNNPDAMVGLGKETGDIEYAADSVSVMIRVTGAKLRDYFPTSTGIIFATSKLRAGRPRFALLEFNGSTHAGRGGSSFANFVDSMTGADEDDPEACQGFTQKGARCTRPQWRDGYCKAHHYQTRAAP